MTPVVVTIAERSIKICVVRADAPSRLHEALEPLCRIEKYQQFASGGSTDREELLIFSVKAEHQDKITKLAIETGDYVGFFWIVPGLLGLRIDPKVNKGGRKTDILCMLRRALRERENLEHLDNLFEIDFRCPPLVEAKDSDGLGLFLAAMYLSLLKKIARKGLRMQFYEEDEIFLRKIKGRVLFSQSIAGRRTPRLSQRLHCRYQEFGVDTTENRILKRALRLLMSDLRQSARRRKESKELLNKAGLLLPLFDFVTDTEVDVRAIEKMSKAKNPVFRDQTEALDLARKILQMESIGYGDAFKRAAVPVHWIYMPKLFELYVYTKFRAGLPSDSVVEYQRRYHHQIPDFLCSLKRNAACPELTRFFIADAKYKPRYAEGNSDMVSDIRQLSGYARVSGILDYFQGQGLTNRNAIIPCLIIYPDQSLEEEEINLAGARKVQGWEGFFKIGLPLPETATDDRVARKVDALPPFLEFI